MSSNTTTPQALNQDQTRFYQRASFPWALIIAAIIFGSGIVAGWTLRSENASQVTAQATVMADKLTSKK